jgi:thiol-disulfide isomerase/thioredoxin
MTQNQNKPIKITLFHAEWCGHCVSFMPTWKQMMADKDANKNISFEAYEEQEIDSLPEKSRTLDGADVRSFGYPMIKMSVDGTDYSYEGRRTPSELYGYILNRLKKTDGNLDKGVVISQNDNQISISTDSQNVRETLSEMTGGGNKRKTNKVRLRQCRRLITDSDFIL